MFRYYFSIIFYPFTYLWNNIICRPIYGVSILSVFLCVAFGVAVYRFLIIPYTTGASFYVSIKDYTKSHSNKMSAVKNTFSALDLKKL